MIFFRILVFIIGVGFASQNFGMKGTVIVAVILGVILIQGQMMLDDQTKKIRKKGE